MDKDRGKDKTLHPSHEATYGAFLCLGSWVLGVCCVLCVKDSAVLRLDGDSSTVISRRGVAGAGAERVVLY
jgi:hypothetical protein